MSLAPQKWNMSYIKRNVYGQKSKIFIDELRTLIKILKIKKMPLIIEWKKQVFQRRIAHKHMSLL